MDTNTIKNKLASVNWNFDYSIDYRNSTIRPFNCRKYFSYPATFIPEIPYALIEILSKKGDTVVDVFGGIGTTFMQALLLERKPYSFDSNPIATNVCNTLYFLFDPQLDKEDIERVLVNLCDFYDNKHDYSLGLTEQQQSLNGWFEVETFNELAFLIHQIERLEGTEYYRVLKFVVSSMLVSLSSQNKGWAYIADNVKPKEDELRRKHVFIHYKNTIKTLFSDIREYERLVHNSFGGFYNEIKAEPRIFAKSITDASFNEKKIDLVITSPPYPRMIDYNKSQRLSFNLFNESYKEYCEQEIGARCKRKRKDSLTDYKELITSINQKTVNLMKDNAFFCVVLPDYSEEDDRKIVITDIVDQFHAMGLEKVSEIGRYIPSHKRTLSIQWATLVNETLYVFRKG